MSVGKKLALTSSIILAIVILGFLSLLSSYSSFLKSEINKDVTIVVEPGSSKLGVLNYLERELDLSKMEAFSTKLYLLFDEDLQFDSGQYYFSSATTHKEMLTNIRNGSLQVGATFLEGWRVEQNALYLADLVNTGFAEEYFLSAQDSRGYLFPDTYYIDTNTTAEELVEKQLTNFENKTSDLFENYQGSLEEDEIVTIASIVEREVREEEDRKIVAGILIKRYLQGMALDADATTQYAVANSKPCSDGFCNIEYWPKDLTQSDLEINDLYNTRGRVGLPPTPISNPSLESIESVLDPTNTSFYYYLNDSEGNAYYAETLEQHVENINTYL